MTQTEPYWLAPCEFDIAQMGGTPCPPEYCDRFSYLAAMCLCKPPFENGCAVPTPGCCPYSNASPIYVARDDGGCWCCCGWILSGGRAPDESAAELRHGPTVDVAVDGSLERWEKRAVAFSAGTFPVAGVAVRLRFRRGGEEAAVVAHRDRPFLTAGRALRRAGALVPGADALVDRHGDPLPLLAVEEAEPQPLHHLATSREPATGVGGHLVLLDGVVAGDFALQLADLDAVDLTPGHS